MSGAEWIGIAIRSIPLIGKAGRWLLERGLEVTIHPPAYPIMGQSLHTEPKFILAVEPSTDPAATQVKPYVYSLFRLRLINHRTDRPERVIAAQVVLKQRRWWCWHETLFELPLLDDSGETGKPVEVQLQPMSAPLEIDCKALGDIPNLAEWSRARRIEEWLVLDMVGPIRRVERCIHTFERRPAN